MLDIYPIDSRQQNLVITHEQAQQIYIHNIPSYRNSFIIESLVAYIENMGLQFIDLAGDDKTPIIKTRWDLMQSLIILNSIIT